MAKKECQKSKVPLVKVQVQKKLVLIKDKYNKKNEGGNAFDPAITYAEEVIRDPTSAEEA